MIEVSNVRIEGNHLLGNVTGHEVYYRFPQELRFEARGELFLTLALFLGVSTDSDVCFDESAPLSPALLKRLPVIQSLLQQWNPGFSRINVVAHAVSVPRLNPGVLSAYSGGVDSSCTLVEHLEEITHVMTLNMFDVKGETDANELFAKNRVVSSEFGKVYLPIESNMRDFFQQHRMRWDYGHGPFLCLLAAGLGFDRFYIPSSYTYRDLKPWGSHPSLDPMWSTETTEIVHDGAHHRRSEKTAIILSNPTAFRHLQVCWNSKVSNCGICKKCTRTMIVLNMLGSDSGPFPAKTNAELLPFLRASSALSASFIWDILLMAERRGEAEIASDLRHKLRRFAISSNLKQAFRQLIGARSLARMRKAFRPNREAAGLVTMLDPDQHIF